MTEGYQHGDAAGARVDELARALEPGALGDALYDLSAELLGGGYPCEVLLEDLKRLVLGLRARGEEDKEDAVLDVMNALTGWCAPSARLESRAAYPEPARAALPPGEREILESGGAVLGPLGPDEDDPRALTAAKLAAVLAGAATVEEAARMLGTEEGEVRRRIAERTLYAVEVGGGYRLPAFQFAGGREVPGVGEVLAVFDPGQHPLGVVNWFSLPKPELRAREDQGTLLSPRDWLLSGGGPDALVPLARDLEWGL